MLKTNHLVLNVGASQLLVPGFSMQLSKGRMGCLAGESGCGKTSLLRAILGLADIANGSIEVDGIRVSTGTLGEVRRHVAYLPQELALPVQMVAEMAELPFTLSVNAHKRNELKRLPQELQKVGLEEELMHRRVDSLSGGQRQRIMLCVATLLGKPLLLLDEPSSALDADSAQMVGKYIKHYCHTTGAAALVVSHDHNIKDLADNVWTLQ